MKYLKYSALCAAAIPIIVVLSCSGGNLDVIRESKIMMGTIVEIAIGGSDEGEARLAIKEAFDEIGRIEDMMSRHRSESDLSRLNREGSRGPVQVPRELFDLLGLATEISEDSGGAFDVTIGPVASRWAFDTGGVVPSQHEIDEAKHNVGYAGLIYDFESIGVGFSFDGMALDVGGIAKGYALDAAAAKIIERGVGNAIIDAGGDMRLIGGRPGKGHWRIGIQHPRSPGRLLVTLDLADTAIVTSGDYERFFIAEETRYHHILDPATGRPARGCQSVTVLAPTAAEADACATAVFVLGPEKGLAFLRSRPGVRGLVVDSGGGLHWTDEQLSQAARR